MSYYTIKEMTISNMDDDNVNFQPWFDNVLRQMQVEKLIVITMIDMKLL